MGNYREDIVNIELTGGNIHRAFLHKTIGAGDNWANRFGVRVFRNGVPEALSGSCYGLFIRADGETVPVENGTISGNVAYVTLTQACYAVEGVFTLAIKVQTAGDTVTLRIVDGIVTRTSTDVIADPGTVLPSIEQLIAAIDEAVSRIPADYTAMTKTVRKNYAYQENEGRTTVCVPFGEVKTDTIITKGTGVDRAGTGSGNNWVTKNFIPVPKGKFYVISKQASFYIAGYSENFEFVADVNDESSLHAIGIQEIDNEEYNFAYIRIGFYSSGGYSARKYETAEVLYYTETVQESSHLITSQRLRPATVNTTEGISSINFSTNRIGPDRFVKAEKNIQIIRDGNASHNWRYLLILGKNPTNENANVEKVFDDWNYTTQAQYGTIIPKGSYYWLGYSIGDDNQDNVDVAILNVPKYIHVRELDDGEPGFFSFGNFDVTFTNMSRVGLPEKLYADTDLFLVAEDNDYVFSVKFYADGEWDSPAWTWNYSVKYVYIPKGTWFRYNVGRADGGTLTPEKARVAYKKVRAYRTWETGENMAKLMMGIQTDLSAVRRRIEELENNRVPEYFETHIAAKAETINGHREQMETGDQFFFITDIHINGYGGNTMHSKSLINYLCRNTYVRKLFNGGDLFNSGYGMPEAEALDTIQKALIYTQPDDCGAVQYFVMGNHDLGDDYVDGDHYGPSIVPEQLYMMDGNSAKRSALVFDPKSDSSYYFDSNGIRYIVSNFGIDSYTGESIGNTYLFVSKAIKSATTPVVIIQHVLWNNTEEEPSFRPYRLQQLENIVDACNARGTVQYGDGADYIVDFSETTGRVCCIIGGHLHEDRYSYTPGGVPIIATTTDCWGGETGTGEAGRADAEGTIKEQAFDVFTVDVGNNKVYATRIGYGNDREFNIPSIGE